MRVERRLRSSTVADADDFVAEQRDSTEEIFDRLLRAEADREAADADPGERGSQVESESAQQGESSENHHHRFDHAPPQKHE